LEKGRFPNNEQFIAFLSKSEFHKKLFDSFIEAAKSSVEEPKPIHYIARSNNTTIGIPAKSGASDKNTLCRIPTTESYETAAPISEFQIELPLNVYKSSIAKIETYLKQQIPIKFEISDNSCHENKAQNEKVYRIKFFESENNNIQKDVMAKAFKGFINELQQIFENC
jgi:hypothetical protein